MGLFDKLFGGSRERTSSAAVLEAPPCPHVTLVPHWDSPADMGINDKASSFACEACGQSFTPEQARELRETAADRLPEAVEEKSLEEMNAKK
jgi:hypothetical protein